MVPVVNVSSYQITNFGLDHRFGHLLVIYKEVMLNKTMDEEYQKCSKQYSVSYMNNAKWRKLFTAWAKSKVVIKYAEYSYICSNRINILPLPKETDLMENRFADGLFQPFEYKWIESISIPNKYRPKPKIGYEIVQDVEKLKKIVATLGEFPIYDTANGILVLGYKK